MKSGLVLVGLAVGILLGGLCFYYKAHNTLDDATTQYGQMVKDVTVEKQLNQVVAHETTQVYKAIQKELADVNRKLDNLKFGNMGGLGSIGAVGAEAPPAEDAEKTETEEVKE